ncbi:MAG: hypothetical protein CSA24_00365 [Deltaproteobacteria bacterium]|nr:MAG: hypothetical protein CSB49_03035 [Pseudomonadota bacterium]PIE66349.1 MAG: hypothetical protein CSA24_00365 [Deltaproteobacteria bacterium]
MGLRQKSLVRRTHRYWHLLFFAVVLAVLFAVLRGLGKVLTPVVAALVLAYLLDPLVSWAKRRLRTPRWVSTLLLLLLGLLFLVLIFSLLIPVLVDELHQFGTRIQHLPKTLLPWVEKTFDVELPHSFKELWAKVGGEVKGASGSILGSLGGVAGKVAKGTAGVLGALGALASSIGTIALIPVFTFYFLPQFPLLVSGARGLIPYRYRPWVDDTVNEIDRVLASWIRGQLTVMAILALLYALGLRFIAQLDMAVLIGLITGLLAFIPYVGFTLGLILGLTVCLLREGGVDPTQLVVTLAVFGAVQVLDGLVLTPRIVGNKTGMGPVGVLVALLLGGKLFGFVGVLLAVPVAAALVVVIKRGVVAYKGSLFFRRGRDDLLGEEPDDQRDAANPSEPR